jgi:integrase/recombinase XerD
MSKPKSKVITVRVVGPLEPYAGQFRSLLAARGYAPLTQVPHLQVMTHLSKWMATSQLTLVGLTGARVEEYLVQRRDGHASFCTRASLAPLLEVLAAAGAPLNEPDQPVLAADALLDAYAQFLRQERGLAASTTSAYVLRAQRFLAWHGHGADLRAVDTTVVTGAVLGEADRVSSGSAQFFVVALRSFLRYCYLAGVIDTDLSAASLPVTGRCRSVLPHGISAADARALLRACDRRTAAGRRDYAVILLLTRLGLRACEVAALRLEDNRLARRRAHDPWQVSAPGPAAVTGRCRRGDRRLPATRPSAWDDAAGSVLAQHRTQGQPDARGGGMPGAPGEHPRRVDPVRAAPAAARAGLRHGPGRGDAEPDRAGSPAR